MISKSTWLVLRMTQENQATGLEAPGMMSEAEVTLIQIISLMSYVDNVGKMEKSW